ncbi:MAG: LysE family transporter [Candidatus Delongbacteria bacterium]|nr:LysE family transporter [Candidatus Delongbacteria bacterium]
MTDFLILGAILGLSAGIAPGPLLTLVISETLQHNIKSGIKIALAPIITDLPIILLTLFILSKLSAFNYVLGIISFSGGFFLIYMGYENIRIKNITVDFRQSKPKSLLKGVIANILSPHPYLFWLTIGSPILIRAMKVSNISSIFFISSFYIFITGSKIVIAILVGKSKSFLNDKAYLYTMKMLGIALFILAVILFYDGLILMKVI